MAPTKHTEIVSIPMSYHTSIYRCCDDPQRRRSEITQNFNYLIF